MFDYRVLHTCQYEVAAYHNEVSDCGEPATHEVWWDGNEATGVMIVCQEHFDFITKCEAENED